MRYKKVLGVIFACALVIGLGTASWWKHSHSTLKKIQKQGELVVLTANNANCYYIYREAPMGFEYELARAFAESLGVKLRIKTPPWSQLLDRINTGGGDLIAAGMTRTQKREQRVHFSKSYLAVQQMMIVHKHNYGLDETEDLAGKTVHVRRNTTYHQRLKELQAQGIDLAIELYEDMSTEELIQMVAQRKIPVTVADSNIALLNRRYYPDIKIAFPIEKKQQLGWAVANGDTRLLAEINRFVNRIKKNGTLKKIYSKYYSNIKIFDYLDLKTFHKRLSTRLPEYKPIIKRQADRYDFDWRLIAAVIYQESHFNPFAESFTGVQGIMQLTRTTAAELGVTNRLNPRQSIRGGVRYLARMLSWFSDIPDRHNRLLFALASYNIGYGHVRDAQKLALQKGLDPTQWDSLKKTLPLLRKHQYYRDTRHGYARGTEPVRYVERILTYYDILKQKAVGTETSTSPAAIRTPVRPARADEYEKPSGPRLHRC